MGNKQHHAAEAHYLDADKSHGGAVPEHQHVVGHQGFDGSCCPGPGLETGKQSQLKHHGQEEGVAGQEHIDQVPVAQRQHKGTKGRCRRRGNKHDQPDQPEQSGGFLPANLVPHNGRYRYRTEGTANALHHAPGDHTGEIVGQCDHQAGYSKHRKPRKQDVPTPVTVRQRPAHQLRKPQRRHIGTQGKANIGMGNTEAIGDAGKRRQIRIQGQRPQRNGHAE